MKIKGTAFIAREVLLSRKFGKETWDGFHAEMLELIPTFPKTVTADSIIPMAEFLAFTDEMIDRLFDGDPRSNWNMGRAAADWGLIEGPFGLFFETTDIAGFLGRAAMLWNMYYEGGRFHAVLSEQDTIVDAKVTELDVPHIHFEYNVMGYLERALELLGAKVERIEPLLGISLGDDDVHYRFYLSPPSIP